MCPIEFMQDASLGRYIGQSAKFTWRVVLKTHYLSVRSLNSGVASLFFAFGVSAMGDENEKGPAHCSFWAPRLTRQTRREGRRWLVHLKSGASSLTIKKLVF